MVEGRFSGRRAVVTGATSGIGRAVAQRLAGEGARVLATGRREERLATLVREHAAGAVVPVVADHTRDEDNERVVETAARELGGVDIVVNAAGILVADSIAQPDPAVWRRVMDVNVEAVYQLTRRLVPLVRGSAHGSIVNVSSVCSYRPFAGIAAYCVSKAAIDMLTRVLALELAPDGVRVNAVNPGVVVTELHTSGGMRDYDAFLERGKSTHPLGRVGRPEEIAALVAWLCSDEAGWITGGIHAVDGGRGLTSLR